MIIQTTQRAYRIAESGVTLRVRDETGKVDFGGTVEVPAVLSVELRPCRNGWDYGWRFWRRRYVSIPAESTEPGKVTFTVTEDFADHNLGDGLTRFYVKDGDAVVATGLLEIVS